MYPMPKVIELSMVVQSSCDVKRAAVRCKAAFSNFASPMQVALDNLNPGVMVITVSVTTLVYQQRYSLVVQVPASSAVVSTSYQRCLMISC